MRLIDFRFYMERLTFVIVLLKNIKIYFNYKVFLKSIAIITKNAAKRFTRLKPRVYLEKEQSQIGQF